MDDLRFRCALSNVLLTDPMCLRAPNDFPMLTEKSRFFNFERKKLEAYFEKYDAHPCNHHVKLTLAAFGPNDALRRELYEPELVAMDVDAPPPYDVGAGVDQAAALRFSARTKTLAEGLVYVVVDLTCTLSPAELGPIDVYFVIDRSGSMNTKVTKELNRMDLVKQATSACVEVLRPQDSATLVTFSDFARVDVPLAPMNSLGKEAFRRALATVNYGGCTCLTTGLLAAMGVVRTQVGRRQYVFLLTDGKPEGEVAQRNMPPDLKLAELNAEFGVPVHVIGFGYDTDAALLHRMSVAANSPLAFISDASMAATTMTNAIAHASQACFTDLKLCVLPALGFDLEGKSGVTDCGYIVAGQKRSFDFALRQHEAVDSLTVMNLEVQYRTTESPQRMAFAVQKREEVNWGARDLAVVRRAFVTRVSELRGGNREAILQFMFDSQAYRHLDMVAALRRECDQELTLAVDPVKWKTWGELYAASLARAHELEYPLNFKDLSTNSYLTPQVGELANEAIESFRKSKVVLARPQAQAVNFSGLANRQAGCVAGDCFAKLQGGQPIPVRYLKKGDVLFDGGTVVCMLQSCASAFVELPGLLITPYHPMFGRVGDDDEEVEAAWVFPANIKRAKRIILRDTLCFSFVLEGIAYARIGGHFVLGMGHGLDEPGAAHPYFSRLVLEDLRRMRGWEQGLVTLGEPERDADGLVCRLVEA